MTADPLSSLANKYASDKGTSAPSDGKHHGPRLHFTPIYNRHFKNIRKQPLNILEIGVGSGPSLKMWYEYFPEATIHALDITDCAQHNNDRVKTYIADQTNREQLQKTTDSIGRALDIIIDDGGHGMEQQQVSLGFLFKYLKPNGMYFIEDLHTSYWPVGSELYGQNIGICPDRSNTTVKMLEDYMLYKKITSAFLTTTEMEYLNTTITEVQIFDLPATSYGPNRLALIKK